MRFATWNVNSVKARLPYLLNWLETREPDLVCLQELKVTREAFPTIPPRVEYTLTEDGLEFRKITLPVLKWAARRSPPKGHTPRQT